MRPTLLFDKSALQALSVDEAVWLDQFFLPVICPIFFVETLADLEKSIRAGRTPEQEVGLIAAKTPQMSGYPNVSHVELCIAKLHQRCAPLFLRENQQFLWGPDLKQELRMIDVHFSKLPEEEKEKGLFAISQYPPEEDTLLTTRLWDLYLPRWRSNLQEKITLTPEMETSLVKQVREITDAEPLPYQADFDFTNADSVSLKRRISHRRGKWWQLGKDFKAEESNDPAHKAP